jgi:exodeoxyribonuclease VII large subunit
MTLRDPVAEVSLRLTCTRTVCDAVEPPLADGARVVVWAKPDFYLQRGSLSLTVFDIRPVGIGALLARLEQLKQVLAAEGLFAPERKRPLPFLPRVVGLVTGRASAAERDVVENARRRWPAVRFRIEPVAVQGPQAVEQVVSALHRLDTDPEVDVIVIARGGGSLEDLLPFSDETLVRAIAACFTPVVSAIGHETDTPLADHVADRRASTPTDAGKLVVPDVAEETQRISGLRERARRCVVARIDRDQQGLDGLRSRPVLASPASDIDRRAAEVAALGERARRMVAAAVESAGHDLAHLRARVVSLSPAATLERGYAVLQTADGSVVRDPAEVSAGDPLDARVAAGRFRVTVAP